MSELELESEKLTGALESGDWPAALTRAENVARLLRAQLAQQDDQGGSCEFCPASGGGCSVCQGTT